MKDSAIKVVIDVGSSRTRVTIGEVGNREDSVLEVLGSGFSTAYWKCSAAASLLAAR